MNAFLETGISLVLIFFIFSIITYVIQELIAVNLKYRSKMLWKSMAQLFDGFDKLEGRMKLMKAMPVSQTPNTTAFYKHAQILSLQRDLKRRPNYIPAANFALAVMDLVAQKVAPTARQNDLFKDFKSGLQTFAGSKGSLHEVLKNLLATSDNIKDLQKKLEGWFNNYMNRVTGWYESHTVVSVRLIAVALTLVFNINVIKLAKTIYKDGKLRTTLVAMAEKMIDNPEVATKLYTSAFNKIVTEQDSIFKVRIDSAKSDQQKAEIQKEKEDTLAALAGRYTEKKIAAIKSLTSQLDSTDLPLGWKEQPFSCKYWKDEEEHISGGITFLLTIIGWIIGACCISMGAPFWFDMLNKLVNVRRSGIKPPK